MRFLLQQGSRMLNLIEEFIDNHDKSGVILSPRACERDTMERYVERFRKNNAIILFDPQFYDPRTDIDKILSFPYWERYDFQTNTFNLIDFCHKVIEYQINHLNVNSVIIPGRYTNTVSDSWLEMQYKFAETASTVVSDKDIFSTLALGADAILNREGFDTVIDELINFPIQGVYFVFEHPDNRFLIDNEDFIYAILDATLSINLSGKSVIIGYSNQQSLIFAASGVELIASGNYRNVRIFDHNIFSSKETGGWQKNVWYFDGNSLGEYQKPRLSLAFKRGLSSHFGPLTSYSKNLLESDNPANVLWGEHYAFRHYLEMINDLWIQLEEISKNQRYNAIKDFLIKIKNNNEKLIEKRFNLGERGFHNVIEPTINALDAFIYERKIDIESL